MDSANQMERSALAWIFEALGPFYFFVLPLAGLLSCLGAILLIARGRGVMSGAALILVVHIPFLVGVFGAIHGMISSFSVIATAGSTPKPSEVAVGLSTALFVPMVGLVTMVPGYAIALIGAFCRAFGRENETA